MSKKTNWSIVSKLTLFVLVSWIILAIIFGIYDLDISIAVFDGTSAWGNFGADYGELPGYALIGIALATFVGGYIKNLKLQKIPALIIIAIGMLFIIIDSDYYTGFSLIIPMIIYTIITWNKDWKNYRALAGIISLLAIINPLLFVQIFKILWGRVRFRDLASGFVDYTPWFLPQGITGNKSFPSGHTAMSFMLLPLLIPLSKTYLSNHSKKFLALMLIIVVIGWAIFVAASRVIVGAHYASDVLFSGGAACIITILLYKWRYMKRE